MNFGKRLKKLHTNARLTQAQLAEMVGVTKSVISFYELQERIPSPEVLIRFSQVFHVSADYLLGLDSKETIDVTGLAQDDITLIRALAERLRNRT